MRETAKHIKLTQREDEAHIRALVQAVVTPHSEYHTGVLRDVKQFLIDTNGELSPAFFKLFRDVLVQLRIDLPQVTGGGPEGGRYPIPAKDPAKSKALKTRRDYRRRAWDLALAEAGITEADADLLLTERIQQASGLMSEITELQKRADGQTDGDMRAQIEALRAEIAELRAQAGAAGGAGPSVRIGDGLARPIRLAPQKPDSER